MATLTQANDARAQHADALAKLGAHAVGVRQQPGAGNNDWAVVAYMLPDARAELPSAITAQNGGANIPVPLIVERAEPFSPE